MTVENGTKNRAIFTGILMLFAGMQVLSDIRPVNAAETQSAGVYVFKDAKRTVPLHLLKNGKTTKITMKDRFLI